MHYTPPLLPNSRCDDRTRLKLPLSKGASALCNNSREVQGEEPSFESGNFRSIDSSLQPATVMESGIPVADRRVVFPEGDSQVVIVVVPDKGALHPQDG